MVIAEFDRIRAWVSSIGRHVSIRDDGAVRRGLTSVGARRKGVGFNQTHSDPVAGLSCGRGGSGRLLRLRLDVVEVQNGVEQQVELAEVLPAIARVPGEQD